MMSHKNAVVAALAAFACPLFAADYYVATTGNDGNDGSSGSPFATIDKAISTAAAGDNIYVSAGTYSTTTEYGPNLVANLIGTGATRDDVVIGAGSESDRTLKMQSGSLATNITFVGNTANKVYNGGAIYMLGGTLVDCVVRDGTSLYKDARSGGNVMMLGGVIDSCVISNGTAASRGGNIDIEGGTIRNSLIAGGKVSVWGGNIYMKGSSALVTNCVIVGGMNTDTSADNAYGGNVHIENSGKVVDCVISNGVSHIGGGNVYLNGGSALLADCLVSGGHIDSTANSRFGANVHVVAGSTVSRCRLAGGSTGSYDGGSLCVNNAGARVEDCLVEGSQCGGVLLYTSSYLYNCTIVDNRKYGCWAWNNNQHFFNTVIYGNDSEWNGNVPSNANAEIEHCATSSGSRLKTDIDIPTLVVIDSAAFAAYSMGDYHPAQGGLLVDAGTTDPRGAAASTTDLDGKLRTSDAIDIGCYEFQKTGMIVHIDNAVYSQVYAPSTVTFTHSTDNSASPGNVVFTYDFGDGSEPASTGEATISHVYGTPGVYTVVVTAVNEAEGESAAMTYVGYVRVASSTVYVTPGNASPAFPYNTPATGYALVKTAVQNSLDGYTLLLGEGVHETSDQIPISSAITVRGLGARPEDVIVRNTTATPDTYYHRTMELNNANGRIENITIENGCVKNRNGGNLRLVLGVVSNCVIRGGLAVADNGDAAGSAVELGDRTVPGTPTLTHCVISNNVVQGTSNSGNSAGGAIYVPYEAKTGRISNCLIVYNRYVTSGDAAKTGAAGIRLNGSNDNIQIENNTIVTNTVEGSLADDSAGVYCTTWYGRVRNNIVVGNYETGKEKCTAVRMDKEHGTYVSNLTDADASATDLFKDFAKGDFAIKPGCAAYDAGTSSLTLRPSVDLAGNPRVYGKAIDVGCYECQRKPGFSVVIH